MSEELVVVDSPIYKKRTQDNPLYDQVDTGSQEGSPRSTDSSPRTPRNTSVPDDERVCPGAPSRKPSISRVHSKSVSCAKTLF